MKEREDTIYFATGNRGKYREVAQLAEKFGVHLKRISRPKKEIQADNLEEIACFAAKEACAETLLPVVVEDSGFFVHALGGFPGPYSSYVHATIGNTGILKLMKTVADRDAYFEAVVVFCRPNLRAISFVGVVKGAVSRHAKGHRGFGFDPIFIPRSGQGHTFAEMSTSQKNTFSHRSKAFTNLFEWLRTKRTYKLNNRGSKTTN